MDDLISRQAAIQAIDDLPNCYNGYSDTYDKACIIGVLEELPSVQPEQKRGKWIESTELSEQVKGKKFCSNCGKAQYAIELTDKTIQIKSSTSKFCPECGARMEETE